MIGNASERAAELLSIPLRYSNFIAACFIMNLLMLMHDSGTFSQLRRNGTVRVIFAQMDATIL